MQPKFSIVLPVYKQTDQIETIYKSYSSELQKLAVLFELLFVVNGPDEGQAVIVKKIAASDSSVRLLICGKSGYGRAVKQGFTHARGAYIAYVNSARTRPSDLTSMLRYTVVDPHVVIKANRIIRDRLHRKAGSIIFNIENRLLFRTPIWDVNGVPKIFPRSVLEKIDIPALDNNSLFDADLMNRCYAAGVLAIDIPLKNTERIGGKSTTNTRTALTMYTGLLRMWFKQRKTGT